MVDLGPTELRLMQGLAQDVTLLRQELVNADASVGELAWVWSQSFDLLHPFWRNEFWFVDGRLAGWGWVVLPHRIPRGDGTFREAKAADLLWQVHPAHPELLPEILDWYDEVAAGADQSLIVQAADERSLATVTAHGYTLDENAAADDSDWTQGNVRDLDDVPEPLLPNGFRFTSAANVSVADAVEAHRGAWPKTGLTEAALARAQRTWPYRPELHVLIEAPDGTLAASATIWLDEKTGVAEFEPVGTHQDFRRQGLATALQLHGMRQARAAGATSMLVACIGAPAHPAAKNLYYSVGFRELTRDLPHIKTASRPPASE